MTKSEIERIVDKSFAAALHEIQPCVNRELYPAAFANEYSWLRIKAVFDLQNSAMCTAVKNALSEILGDE